MYIKPILHLSKNHGDFFLPTHVNEFLTNQCLGRNLDCFCRSIYLYIAFTQSHRPEDAIAIPDSYILQVWTRCCNAGVDCIKYEPVPDDLISLHDICLRVTRFHWLSDRPHTNVQKWRSGILIWTQICYIQAARPGPDNAHTNILTKMLDFVYFVLMITKYYKFLRNYRNFHNFSPRNVTGATPRPTPTWRFSWTISICDASQSLNALGLYRCSSKISGFLASFADSSVSIRFVFWIWTLIFIVHIKLDLYHIYLIENRRTLFVECLKDYGTPYK